ncbi:MAG: ABC transporter permease [Alphaproteobacteria bacterium]|nr:ABC transporter permease [Alphaproteobacteria bacterium]
MVDLQGFGTQLLLGAALTLELAFASTALGTLIGLGLASLKLSRSRLGRGLADSYTTIFRGVPELIIVLLVYFGATIVLTNVARLFGSAEPVELHPFIAGMLALGFAFGAYAAEVFRGALQALPRGQIEAARAFGMSRSLAFRRVALPQVWRFALPGLGNIFLVLLKDTSLVSVIGLEEIMRKTSIAVSYTKEPFTFYLAAAVIYLVMTIVSTIGLGAMERRANRGVRRAAR